EQLATPFLRPHLTLSAHGPEAIGDGETARFELAVTNDGAAAAHGLTILVTEPASVVAASDDGAGAADCSPTTIFGVRLYSCRATAPLAVGATLLIHVDYVFSIPDGSTAPIGLRVVATASDADPSDPVDLALQPARTTLELTATPPAGAS